MGTHLPINPLHPPVYPIWQPTGLFFHLVFHYDDSCTTQYLRWLLPIQCEANLATKLHRYRCQVSWKYLLYFSHSVCIHCFMQYTPKLLKLFYPTLLPLFHRNNTHPPPLNFETIPPWPLPRPSSPLRRPRLSSRLVCRAVPE